MHTVKVLGDYIRGRFVRPRGADRRVVSKDPGDAGYRIGSFPVYPKHVDAAVDAAQKGFEAWREVDQAQRANVLRKFSAEVVNHRDKLKQLIAAETGKPLWEASQEVSAVEAQVETEIREGVRSVSPYKVGEIRWGVEGACRYKPLGVMAVLGPAVSPVHVACSYILPALLSGNAVIFKPSKLVPATGQFIARLFDLIDLPSGAFNLLQGDAAIGSALATHDKVSGLLFTGSIPAGKRILQATAEQPHKLVALQMGGVNVALVLEDADLDRAVHETVAGAYLTSGQQYTTTGVILVTKPLFDRFAKAYLETARALRVGYAFDPDVFMGPVLSESARVRFLDRQEQLDRAGARALLLSERIKPGRPGFYVSPAVHVMEQAKSIDDFCPEGLSFGPDVVLVPVPNRSEGVRLANRNSFALVSSVFTEDRQRFEKCASDLEFGVINHNVATTEISLRLPLNGTKQCGNHRPAGVFAQRSCTYPVASLRGTTPFDSNRKLPGFPPNRSEE